MIKFLDLHAQYMSIQPEIDNAIAQVIAETAFVGGRHVKEFENQFAAYVGVGHCVGVANGTDALELAIEALGLPPGSEVIVPGNSFIASSEAVTRCGHRVVFADVDTGSYTLTAEAARAKLSQRTAALMPVHLYGHPCDMDPLLELARERKLRVVEDCAQAHGARYKGRQVGSIGDVATFSFYPGKNLGAYGDAGAVTTNDEALAARVRKIANHGRVAKYDHEFEGRSSRLDGLQAAILSAKLPHLETWIQRRIEVADVYSTHLQGLEDLVLPQRHSWARQVYHLFVVRTSRRDALKLHLEKERIETGVHYPIALPKLAAYDYLGQSGEGLFVNQVDRELLSLPIGEHMDAAQARQVVRAVRSFFA